MSSTATWIRCGTRLLIMLLSGGLLISNSHTIGGISHLILSLINILLIGNHIVEMIWISWDAFDISSLGATGSWVASDGGWLIIIWPNVFIKVLIYPTFQFWVVWISFIELWIIIKLWIIFGGYHIYLLKLLRISWCIYIWSLTHLSTTRSAWMII